MSPPVEAMLPVSVRSLPIPAAVRMATFPVALTGPTLSAFTSTIDTAFALATETVPKLLAGLFRVMLFAPAARLVVPAATFSGPV